MWELHSETFGWLRAADVFNSGTLEGMLTALDVTKDGKPKWAKAYFSPLDLKLVIPPKEM